jgi:porphobilinogen synthase
MRRLVRETRLSAHSLIYPLFVREGRGVREAIESLPGQIRFSPDTVAEGVESAMEAGVGHFLLFGIPDRKDAEGSGAWAEDGVVQRALRAVKARCPGARLIADVCLCEYTDHGHCGVIRAARWTTTPRAHLARAAPPKRAGVGGRRGPSDMMAGAWRRSAPRWTARVSGYAVKATPSSHASPSTALPRGGGLRARLRRPARLSDGPAQRPRGAKGGRADEARAPTS